MSRCHAFKKSSNGLICDGSATLSFPMCLYTHCGSLRTVVCEVLGCLPVSRTVVCPVTVSSSKLSFHVIPSTIASEVRKISCLIRERIGLVCNTLHTTTGTGAWLCCLASNRSSTLLIGSAPLLTLPYARLAPNVAPILPTEQALNNVKVGLMRVVQELANIGFRPVRGCS